LRLTASLQSLVDKMKPVVAKLDALVDQDGIEKHQELYHQCAALAAEWMAVQKACSNRIREAKPKPADGAAAAEPKKKKAKKTVETDGEDHA